MTRFAILHCGHWIADPHHMLPTGDILAPCPAGDGHQLVVASAVDPDVELIETPVDPEAYRPSRG